MTNAVFLVILLNLACFGDSAVKIWRHDNDINNPEHWEGGKAGSKCEGLDFRNMRSKSLSPIVIDRLNVKQIFFPDNLDLYLMDNAEIRLQEDSTDQMNCVQIKDNFASHSWMDPASWITEGAEENVAIPHAERIPCLHDDVVFPKGWKSSSCSMDDNEKMFRVRSFKFGNDYLGNPDLMHFENKRIPIFPIDIALQVTIDGADCYDPSGCLCGNFIEEGICDLVDQPEHVPCLEPITPIGFCGPMCGASIVIRNLTKDAVGNRINIEQIKRALKQYDSHTYVSKTLEERLAIIQIIFAEKEFEGVSLDEAKEFRSMLLSDSSFGVTDALLATSGIRINLEEGGKTIAGLLLGTLFGVLLTFGVIFFVNSSHFNRLNLSNRFHFTSRPLSNLLARYNKMDDETMSFQKAESVTSLEQSFDNPMYGSTEPSVASTSAVTNLEKTSEIHLENPMYDISCLNKAEAVENVMEENQLVDLTSPSKSDQLTTLDR